MRCRVGRPLRATAHGLVAHPTPVGGVGQTGTLEAVEAGVAAGMDLSVTASDGEGTADVAGAH